VLYVLLVRAEYVSDGIVAGDDQPFIVEGNGPSFDFPS